MVTIQFCQNCHTSVATPDAFLCCGRATSLHFASQSPEQDQREQLLYEAHTAEQRERLDLQRAWGHMGWVKECPADLGRAYAAAQDVYDRHQTATRALAQIGEQPRRIRGNWTESPFK